MPTVTVPRDVTSQEVTEALRNGLDPRYEVLPGMQMRRSPLFGRPRPSEPELIVVTAGQMIQAQVRIIPRDGHTDLRITPGGLLGDLLVNTLGIARQVRQALINAPSLDVRSERHRSRLRHWPVRLGHVLSAVVHSTREQPRSDATTALSGRGADSGAGTAGRRPR